MTVQLWQFFVICPLVFLAGFVDSVAGGGGLISLPAYLIAGFPVHYSIGTNKLSSGMGTALATWRFSKKGFIPWRDALICAVCALIGSYTGANLALIINDTIFKWIMLIILPLTAFYITRSRTLESSNEPFGKRKTVLLSMGIALVIGAYDGFYGPGTGTFLLLLLTGIARVPLKSANGVTKVINLTTNLTALFVYFTNGKVMILLGLIAGVFGMAGNFLGTALFDKVGAKSVKPLMMVVLVIFFVRVCSELFF